MAFVVRNAGTGLRTGDIDYADRRDFADSL